MFWNNLRNATHFSLVKKGRECIVGVVVGVKSKYWLLDSKSRNFLFSGGNDFCRSLVLLTIEYLSKAEPNILLFQDCEASINLDKELRRHGYAILYIASGHYISDEAIALFLSTTSPIAIFINSEHVECSIKQILSFIIHNYDECASPIPVLVFLPISAAINATQLVSRARGRNIRFIANGSQLRLEAAGCEMFDTLVAETDLHGTKNTIVCKRGFHAIECNTSLLV